MLSGVGRPRCPLHPSQVPLVIEKACSRRARLHSRPINRLWEISDLNLAADERYWNTSDKKKAGSLDIAQLTDLLWIVRL